LFKKPPWQGVFYFNPNSTKNQRYLIAGKVALAFKIVRCSGLESQ